VEPPTTVTLTELAQIVYLMLNVLPVMEDPFLPNLVVTLPLVFASVANRILIVLLLPPIVKPMDRVEIAVYLIPPTNHLALVHPLMDLLTK